MRTRETKQVGQGDGRTLSTGLRQEFSVRDVREYHHGSPFRWVLSHVCVYFWLPVLVLLCAVLENFAYSSIQVYIGKAFDWIMALEWTRAELVQLALIMLVLAVVQGLTGLGRNIGVEFLAQRIERNTREELYRSLLGKSQTFHGRQKIGDIMARATNDVRMLNLMFSPGLMLIMDSLLSLLVPLVLIALIDVHLLLVPICFSVGLVVTVWDYNKRLKPVSIAQRDQFGEMNAGLTEAINGIEVIKANVQERYELDKFVNDARIYRDYFVKMGIIQAKYWPMFVFALAWGAAFFHGLYLWRLDRISLGQVVAFIGLFGTFRFVTFISIFSFNMVQLGLASADRILKLIVTETELDQNEAGMARRIAGRVEFEQVSFGFDGQPVLEEISFRVEPGETIAIVGQTGSGKTTLTRLINRIFDVSAGTVRVDGVDVRNWSLESLRSQISTIEQDVFLFSRTVRKNIAFGRSTASFEEIRRAAEQAQADSFIRDFSAGYDTEVGERGVTLSGGQKQRLAIARAFLTDPAILVLDDSTSAIDSRTEEEIQTAMKQISRQRTTFIITHRLSQIRWADRILVLRRGRLIDQGDHKELLERCDEYRRIFARL
ncbi:ABC transporter ATP-binding protein [bacterium]|nr:ABC transporter ATP-binding protein [bacterium]